MSLIFNFSYGHVVSVKLAEFRIENKVKRADLQLLRKALFGSPTESNDPFTAHLGSRLETCS
jgi:hypothetical protein